MARQKKLPAWYIPWQELEEVIAMIRRADGEHEDGIERAREAERESRENESSS